MKEPVFAEVTIGQLIETIRTLDMGALTPDQARQLLAALREFVSKNRATMGPDRRVMRFFLSTALHALAEAEAGIPR